MALSLEALTAALVAAIGAWLGFRCSRLPKPFWTVGYFVPLALVALYGLASSYPPLSFLPPASWLLMGRHKFALLGFVIAMLLSTPLSRLTRKRDRLMVGLFMAVFIMVESVWPHLAPLAQRHELALLKTDFRSDGVCRQTTSYTCGPAAAVTALRWLGLPAEEGKLSLLAETSSAAGTSPDILAETLRKEYAKDGLIVQYRLFRNLAELRQAGLTLAVVKYGFLIDHFITVLQVTDTEVVIGDPLVGVDRLSHDDFCQKWRYRGIVLSREMLQRNSSP